MRILSQCSNIDIPYKEASLRIDMGGSLEKGREVCIYARISSMEKDFVMARYKTHEKARKAMEMLQNEYHGYKIEETYHKGAEYYNPIFQFPSDDEVEV